MKWKNFQSAVLIKVKDDDNDKELVAGRGQEGGSDEVAWGQETQFSWSCWSIDY